ncbi:T9SS type A sorting domain-containing protein [Brumimicrobium aurantiacum]|nr:T9SS type A sorting domain-containing protein [Brumimicrobium aurantiacum]
MKNQITFLCCITLFLISISTFGQSISGNMNSGNIASLGYGNVDIYQGEKKIASVLTDELGNFNVELDTGYYRVEFNYEGHEKLVQNIHVDGDEKNDFALKRKKGYAPPVEVLSEVHTESTESYSYSKEERMMFGDALAEIEIKNRGDGGTPKIVKHPIIAHDAPIKSDYREVQSRSNTLTAGEINDFAKWDMWNDITADELSQYKTKWDMFFSDRYTVLLKNEDDYPIVDAVVQLLDESGNLLYESRTDNTGKAELWGKIGVDDISKENVSARIFYGEASYRIRRLIPFKEGVNSKVINVDCGASNQVDIAFVVDATGSMGDEINYLKKDLNEVIFKAKNANPSLTFNFANVFYRDVADDYLTKKQDFTTVLSTAVNFITQQKAAGGGDYEEAVAKALSVAIHQLKWSESARTRILFLVLDAPPHNSLQKLRELKELARAAASKGIRIVPLAASGIKKDTEYLMRSFALASNGTYAFLTNHSGIGNTHIEPSTDEYEVELLNDLMIRIIDTYAFVDECNDEKAIEEPIIPDESDTLISLEWNVWPNPTQGDLNIKIGEDIGELFITDLTGKIMMRFGAQQKNRVLTTNIAQFSRGIYLVTFTYNEKVYTKKIVLL